MCLFKKNKFKKLKREDVVNAIIDLTDREEAFEKEVVEKQLKIKELYLKGKAEKDPNLRMFYAKKINFLKEEIKNQTSRTLYLLYNLKLLNRLKDAIDDNEFISNVSNLNLSDLLGDQKGLAQFLNKALNTKVKAEEVLTSADDIFNEVKDSYDPNERIYSPNDQDDETLAMFELDDQLDIESDVDNPEDLKEPENPNGEEI